MSDEVAVTHEPERHCFVLSLDGRRVGAVFYDDRQGRRHFTHTEVDLPYTGRGLASTLVHKALVTTRKEGLRIVPECEFVAAYVERHPEFADLR